MANPTLNEKRFEAIQKDDEAGWAAPVELAHAEATGAAADHPRRPHDRQRRVRQDVRAVPPRARRRRVGWSQTDDLQHHQPGRASRAGRGSRCSSPSALAMVCVFKPKASPFLGPLYALVEGVFLGVISKAFEVRWDGIVFQAVLATVGVFFATLALYVFGVVKVTRQFQMVVIGATFGIFLLYLFGALLSLFGVDVVFWNQPSALGIIISVVICCRRVAEPVPRLRVHPPGVDRRRAEVHGVVRRVRDHGHAGVDLPRDAAPALTPAALSRALPDQHRQLLPAAHGAGVRLLGALPVDVPLREAVEHLVERDAALEPGQRGTQAEVDAVAEREVVVDLPLDVEAVGVGEVALVAVARRGEQHHHVAGLDLLPVVLDVLRDVPGLHR